MEAAHADKLVKIAGTMDGTIQGLDRLSDQLCDDGDLDLLWEQATALQNRMLALAQWVHNDKKGKKPDLEA